MARAAPREFNLKLLKGRMADPEGSMPSSAEILGRFFQHRGHDYRLALEAPFFELLEKLGDPHKNLPPVFHVAGTNGKGSTCAFLKSLLEAGGYKAHVYTSPHLIRFHERIRIAGELITEDELVELLLTCEAFDKREQISDFEAATAVAFAAFARHKADFTILEVGLGGRLDATNVVDNKRATLITRLSYDHRDYLGTTLSEIADEKAGIMREDVPCFIAPQPNMEAREALRRTANEKKAPLHMGGEDWRMTKGERGFRFSDATSTFDIPEPGLLGLHQYQNAGLAIASLSVLPTALSPHTIAEGLKNVSWPARLQKITTGRWKAALSPEWELWLDGGHNDSAGEVLAQQAEIWMKEDGEKQLSLHLILGMLKTKAPEEFVTPLAPFLASVTTISIPGSTPSFTADDLAARVEGKDRKEITSASSLAEALKRLQISKRPGRLLIAGSLYLAGYVLKENQ